MKRAYVDCKCGVANMKWTILAVNLRTSEDSEFKRVCLTILFPTLTNKEEEEQLIWFYGRVIAVASAY